MTKSTTMVAAEAIRKGIGVPMQRALEARVFRQEQSDTENRYRRHLRSGCKALTPKADLGHQVKLHGMYGERIS